MLEEDQLYWSKQLLLSSTI